MLLRTLLALVCLNAAAPCQNGEAGEEVQNPDVTRRIHEAKEKAGRGDKEAAEDGRKNLTPEQMLARNITSGASAFCRFYATVKPNKLMPGQSGVVSVAAILMGDAVIPTPPPMEMIGAAQQGVIGLGPMSFVPAEPGTHAKGYLGRPVYDNYAIFEVPVTVSPDAEVGKKHRVAIDMRFDLYDGNSGQPVGRFVDQVSTEIEIGRALDPAVAVPREGAARSSEAGKMAIEPTASEPLAEAKPQRVLEGSVIEPVAAPAPVPLQPDGSASEIPVGVDTSETLLPLPMLVGGGVLLLGIVLLLARRK
jgi:hypothetical protein